MQALQKVALTVVLPQEQAAEAIGTLSQAVENLGPGLQVFVESSPVAGPVEPEEWLDGGPPVLVLGVWDTWACPDPGVDFFVRYVVEDLKVREHRVRIVGRISLEDPWLLMSEWEIPKEAGRLLRCDEQLAQELLERLAEQVYREFAPMPTEPPPLEARME